MEQATVTISSGEGSTKRRTEEENKQQHEKKSKAEDVVADLSDRLPYAMVDLRDLRGAERETLLRQVYDELLLPHFPVEGELDDFEDMRAGLDKADGRDPELHIVVARHGDPELGDLAACTYYEYYPTGDFCLMSYICVASSHRRKGLGKGLLRQLELQLLSRTGGQPVTAIYAETHNASVQDGIMDPLQRQETLASLGFRCLDFAYTQPPLNDREEPCGGLRLLVKDKASLPSEAIVAYLDGFAGSVSDWDDSWKTQPYYLEQVKALRSRPHIPASAERPW